MSEAPSHSSKPTTQTYLLAAAIMLALPVLAYVVGSFNVPRPLNLTKTRASVDRDAMRGEIILDALPDSIQTPMAASMEGKIEVLGMSVDKPSAVQGARVEFTFYYRALETVDEDWQIFGHIDGANNVYRIHADHYPAAGKYTTDVWQKGELIADRFVKFIPLDAPSGTYDVWIGFYIGDTRLKLSNPDEVPSDGSNRVKVGTFKVGA